MSKIFDQVVESAAEFSGSGPIEGPGTEVSDSIPARLSDGGFVFTAKATDEIGADNLQRMMEDAEAKKFNKINQSSSFASLEFSDNHLLAVVYLCFSWCCCIL